MGWLWKVSSTEISSTGVGASILGSLISQLCLLIFFKIRLNLSSEQAIDFEGNIQTSQKMNLQLYPGSMSV